MIDRMLRCAMFKVEAFEEVENDKSATIQALLVVVLAAIASAIGSINTPGGLGPVAGFISAIAGWAVWAFLIYVVGTKLLATPETHADWGEVARATGFAHTPGVLAFIGVLGVNVAALGLFVIAIWQIALMVIGIRQALDYKGMGRTIAVVLIAFLPAAIVIGIINFILNPGAFTPPAA